jgi:hypothetical protein
MAGGAVDAGDLLLVVGSDDFCLGKNVIVIGLAASRSTTMSSVGVL